MEHLFTPWRMPYIIAAKQAGCVFCDLLEMADDRAALIVRRSRHAFLVLNRYPYNNGHFLSVPYRHADTLEALSAEEIADMMALVALGMRAVRRTSAPEGFNLGANIGKVAGAGVKDHVHMHVVPRWAGDTNYMAVLAETRAIPELLEVTYDSLSAALASLDAEQGV